MVIIGEDDALVLDQPDGPGRERRRGRCRWCLGVRERRQQRPQRVDRGLVAAGLSRDEQIGLRAIGERRRSRTVTVPTDRPRSVISGSRAWLVQAGQGPAALVPAGARPWRSGSHGCSGGGGRCRPRPPRGGGELEAAVVPVAGVDGPVAAGLALGEAVPGGGVVRIVVALPVHAHRRRGRSGGRGRRGRGGGGGGTVVWARGLSGATASARDSIRETPSRSVSASGGRLGRARGERERESERRGRRARR